MSVPTRYPLAWPEGWKRTPSYQRKAVSGEIKQQKRIAKSIKPTGQFRRPRGEGEPAPAR